MRMPLSNPRRLFKERRYVEYIAHVETHGSEDGCLTAWAYYHSMLLPELNALIESPALPERHKLYFRVLYHAANRHREAFDDAMLALWTHLELVNEKTRFQVAQKIADFAPEQALELLRHTGQAAPEMTLALQEASGMNHAGKPLDTTGNLKAIHPGLLLTDQLDANTRLSLLNALLTQFRLPGLHYKKSGDGFSFNNLACDVTPSSVSGPLVSIIMTTYNADHRLLPALESLFNQSYAQLEIILVDDGSTVPVGNLLPELKRHGKTLRHYYLPENKGTYQAKLAGLEYASGDYVLCHDDDDWSHPLRIELQMASLMHNPQRVATTSSWIRFDETGRPYARKLYPFLRLNPSSMLFKRKQVVNGCGTWDGTRIGADSEFNQRVKLVFGPQAVGHIRKPLAFGLHHRGSLMNAPSTGYSSQQGAQQRLHYTRAWTRWHIACIKQGTQPFMKN